MRAIFFDCFSGISGDMILGAMIDLGVKEDDLLIYDRLYAGYPFLASLTKRNKNYIIRRIYFHK